MSHNRESFGGMDYQWENKHGPVNPQSPFVTAVQQPAKKRTHSVFDSPSKSGGFSTPNCPQLREPNSQHHFFSQQNKPPPYIPAHVQNSKTWEPRTPASVIDFSSGGETPNTPAQDSDAATPDTQMASKMGRLMSGDGKGTPKKSRRESIMNWVRSSPSPSKEKAKDDSRNYYSKKAEHRIMKRRSKKSKAALRDDDSDNEQTGNNNASALQEKPPLGFAAHIPGVLSWVEAHPHLPAVLSFYMQFIVNAAIGFMFLYIIYAGWSAVTNDINIEADKMSHDILHEIALCAKDYKDNYCGSKGRAPALEAACLNWETCMNRDAKKVARASVGAKTFAMIFNAFVEEFSYKSMVFVALFLVLKVLLARLVAVEMARSSGLLRRDQTQARARQEREEHADDLPQSQSSTYTPPRIEPAERTGFADPIIAENE
ncbi:hypothetical protein BU26DRAFT_522850 [Trematosphaeria pertusa]|uniref:Brl1/Brr6 domain-containing protein n=1 Tax=Trematosphaeria pertusa TaxID=390896 RepID=A0A6A6I1K3_9PLEO|nr:uncharacterized protein BU26DRAFT_522850 [Trematosphaeria pertusa]KAF2244147.1 hypothetical protein BU26DRAFT_522850 [Trematosphaeria pertusa]